MLTLSIKQPQGYSFGSPSMTSSGTSPSGALAQPPLCPPMSRRSMAPLNSKRPKLSLQTAILPQPVSPALPLPCSADTPTARNTLANSFRSPATGVEKPEERFKEHQQQRDNAACPYGPESVHRGILKNSPLTNLIRSRREEKERKIVVSQSRTRITFVDEPQIIPRPPQDAELEMDEDDTELPTEQLVACHASSLTPSTSAASPASENASKEVHTRSDSGEWRRLRMQRSVNEGRELRSARRAASSPHTPASAGTPGSSCKRGSSPDCPPQTPETPSPLRTRDWVWTLGDVFNSPLSENPSPSANGSSIAEPKGISRNEEEDDPRSRLLRRVPTGFNHASEDGDGNSAPPPDTPSTSAGTATPMTPQSSGTAASSAPDTPVTPRSVMGDGEEGKKAAMPLRVRIPASKEAPSVPLTPRSLPLPETPR